MLLLAFRSFRQQVYFTLEELTRSETARARGLDNTPTKEHARRIVETVERLLDPLREAWALRCAREGWKSPGLRVSSGYRGFRLNRAVGGSTTSAHCVGWAFDLVPLNGRLAEFKHFCREWLCGRPFDQLISEEEDAAGMPRWVHIGWKDCEGRQRQQMLSMRGGKYKPMTA